MLAVNFSFHPKKFSGICFQQRATQNIYFPNTFNSAESITNYESRSACVQVSAETVQVCRDSLEKKCDEETVGQGETICRTVYQTQCNTRYPAPSLSSSLLITVVEKKLKSSYILHPFNLLAIKRARKCSQQKLS